MKIYYNAFKFDKLPISFGIFPDNLFSDKLLFISKNRNILNIKMHEN